MIIIWVLVPPIWFWLEYFGIWNGADLPAMTDRVADKNFVFYGK